MMIIGLRCQVGKQKNGSLAIWEQMHIIPLFPNVWSNDLLRLIYIVMIHGLPISMDGAFRGHWTTTKALFSSSIVIAWWGMIASNVIFFVMQGLPCQCSCINVCICSCIIDELVVFSSEHLDAIDFIWHIEWLTKRPKKDTCITLECLCAGNTTLPSCKLQSTSFPSLVPFFFPSF